MANKQETRAKARPGPQAKKQAQPERGKMPILGIILGIAAVLLLVAVMVSDTGSEPLGGDEFGEPVITGTALAANIGSNPVDASDDPAFGVVIPEIDGTDFAGNSVSITNDGQPKAILFVSHSCPHCRDEVTEVQSWLDSTGGVDGVQLVTVSTAASSAASNWPPSEWLERAEWTAPVIADDPDSSTFRAFGGSAIPYWVFVDAEGAVTRRNVGRMDIRAAEAAMLELVP
ncbi:MAG: redoxin domain-containing protein [Acidimicrobiia bacterium]|nr:redoxin domain-containing protein [Acidimicrobiia bacterium]MDX2465899.1 redoxin domain-containing protein [Acidimicrobiia bacterium]